MVQCHLCQLWVHYENVGERPEDIIGLGSCHTCRQLPGTVVQLVNTVSKLKATLMQLKDNNAELIQLVKDQCNTNDVIRSENTALIQQFATLRVEANYNDNKRAVHDKLDKLSSDVASVMQPTCEKKSFAAVARCKQRSVLVFDDQNLRNMNTVTTADDEKVELHKTSKAATKDLVAVQWSDVCKNAAELTIVCGDGITEDANMEEVKQDFSGLVITATEDIHRVTISSVLPSTAGTQDDTIKDINNFLRDKCRDTGARFVDNDQHVLFRDGSSDTLAFKNELGTSDHKMVLLVPAWYPTLDTGMVQKIVTRRMGKTERALFTLTLAQIRWEYLYTLLRARNSLPFSKKLWTIYLIYVVRSRL